MIVDILLDLAAVERASAARILGFDEGGGVSLTSPHRFLCRSLMEESNTHENSSTALAHRLEGLGGRHVPNLVLLCVCRSGD